AQHTLGHVDLVRELLDRVGVERDQPVESGNEGDALRLAPQLVPGAVGRRLLELVDEQLQGALVDRPGIVGEWSGLRHAMPRYRGRNIGNTGDRQAGFRLVMQVTYVRDT